MPLTLAGQSQPPQTATSTATGSPATEMSAPSTTAGAGSHVEPPTSTVEGADLAQDRTQLSETDRDELRKFRLERELQEDFSRWVQWQFWLALAVIGVLSFFGIKAYAREMVATELREAARATAKAEASAAQTTATTESVRTAAEEARRAVEQLQSSATDVNKQFGELRARIDAESDHAVLSAERQISALSKQFDELNEFVKALVANIPQQDDLVAKHDAKVAEVKSTALTSKNAFERKSRYTVVVTHHGHPHPTANFANKLLAELKAEGYVAMDGSWASSVPSAFETIRVHYRTGLGAVASEVGALIRDIEQEFQTPYPTEMFEQDMTPLGNYDVVVFLGG